MRRLALLFVAMAAMLAVAAPAVAKPVDNTNHPAYWEAQYPGLTCHKADYEFGDSYTATRWYPVVIVKGGTANLVYSPVRAGDVLTAAINPNSGKPYGISHIIFCKGHPSGPSGDQL